MTADRPADREILDRLQEGPLSAREISERILGRVRSEWAETHGCEPDAMGVRLLSSREARAAGFLLRRDEIYRRLVVMERRGLVQRITLDGHRPMLWRIGEGSHDR